MHKMQNNLIRVINEDFSDFDIGEFPYDKEHSALGEYHYVMPDGYRGNWYDPIVCYKWRSDGPTWIITERDGKKYMEQTRMPIPEGVFKEMWHMLVTGDEYLENFILKAKVRLLSTGSYTGLLFRYIHSRCHYALCFFNQKLCFLKRDQDRLTSLSEVDYSYNCDDEYELEVKCRGNFFEAYVNGEKCMEAEDPENSYKRGKIAIVSVVPAQFTGIELMMAGEDYEKYRMNREEGRKKCLKKRDIYPKPVLWKTIDLKDFGTGRQIRFGHLTGTKDVHIVLAQHQKRVARDSYAHISCLTAIDLDGNILWQLGRPGKKIENTRISADLPFQVYDIDGDGFDEVIAAINFELCILDGRTGKKKKSVPTPHLRVRERASEKVYNPGHAFDRLNVDSICIANFSGKERPSDIVIKDRYSTVWAYDSELNLLWEHKHGNTGHYPFVYDINGDGKDEMIIGYDLVDSKGNIIWSLPVPSDHTDEIIVAKLDPRKKEEVILMASGFEGFIMADAKGNIIKKQMLGHAQRISVGNYRDDIRGLEICVSTFWGSQGIIYIFDCDGNLLHQFEPGTNGNIIAPVNWTDNGTELILLNGSREYGGMIDGYGQRVVEFPDDGHPELCADVIDLVGDDRDEIILWDEEKMYIYTQEDSDILKPGNESCNKRQRKRLKNPLYNCSNYRGEYSYLEVE